jgi:hypothetical protein
MANDGREGATYGSSPGSSTGGMNIGAYGNLVMPEWRAEQPSYGPGTGSSYGYWAREYIGTGAGDQFQVFQPELLGSGCPSITPSGWINPANVMLVEMPNCPYATFFASLKAAGVSGALLASLDRELTLTTSQADIVLGYLPSGAAALSRPADVSSSATSAGLRFGLLKSYADGQRVSAYPSPSRASCLNSSWGADSLTSRNSSSPTLQAPQTASS